MPLPPYLKPGDKVVLYDQHCRFCTLWSGFLARRADHRLKLLAAQSAEGLAILDWFGLAPDHFDTWLFVDGAYACDDNDALLEVLRLLPGPGVTCAGCACCQPGCATSATRRYGATAGAGSAASAHPFVVAPGVPVEPDASPRWPWRVMLPAHQPADPYLPWPLTRANADDCATRYPTPSSTLSWSPRISPGG
ncbi:DCC1-like thiol-disulfide oxidoreductase family protein [Pseudomonas aeruginosa]|nr:DCC1-like thiol-disulfide oxidoreductase family protein [Pseudomonas aeruginosa]